MTTTGWAVLGGVLGALAVTGVGVYLKVQELQSPAFTARITAYVPGVAERGANQALADGYGMTPTRIAQFTQIAARLGVH